MVLLRQRHHRGFRYGTAQVIQTKDVAIQSILQSYVELLSSLMLSCDIFTHALLQMFGHSHRAKERQDRQAM